MSNAVKIECKIQQDQQSQYEDRDMQIQRRSRPSRKASKPRAKVLPKYALNFKKNDWVIQLMKLNPSKINEISASLNTLINICSNASTKNPPSVTNINFNQIYFNEEIYHIFVHHMDSNFYCVKVRDNSGYVVTLKIRGRQNMGRDLCEIFKKMGDKKLIYIYTSHESSSYIQQITQQYRASNLVFVSVQPIPNLTTYSKKEQDQFTFYFQSKIKKMISFDKIIEQFAFIQQQHKESVRSTLNYLQDLNPDAQSLISNILFDNAVDKNELGQILKKGLETFNNLKQRWTQNSQGHFLGKGLSQEKCFWCLSRKSEAVCWDCTQIYHKQVYLCIRNCFQQHHEANKIFMKNQRNQIRKNISFFDSKCTQIADLMSSLTQKQNPEFSQFITYLRSKIISSFNKAAVFANQDQVQ